MDLPEEDYEHGMCGELVKYMYGTRGASQNWEFEYSQAIIGMGFRRGVGHPCIFHHGDYDLTVVVHGDDFTALWVRCCVGLV